MITVIIPAWNRSDDLRQALYSLCAQTKSDFKVIISDDGSTEDLYKVCNEFMPKLDITYIRAKKNQGCGANRAMALEYFLGRALTEYVMFLDSDDSLLPFAIERLEEIITHNDADIIITNILREVGGDSKNLILAKDSRTWLHGKIYRSQFFIDHDINFPVSIPTNEDLAFNLSLYAYDPESYLIDEEVYYFRDNPNSITKQTEKVRNCTSIDYIQAIYYAYLHYKKNKHPLEWLMINNILHCYNYYQRAIAYGTLTEPIKQHMRKMLHDPQVAEVIVSIYTHPEYKPSFDQWTVRDDNLLFFGQTFGSWIMTFFKPEEIKELIIKHNLQNQK